MNIKPHPALPTAIDSHRSVRWSPCSSYVLRKSGLGGGASHLGYPIMQNCHLSTIEVKYHLCLPVQPPNRAVLSTIQLVSELQSIMPSVRPIMTSVTSFSSNRWFNVPTVAAPSVFLPLARVSGCTCLPFHEHAVLGYGEQASGSLCRYHRESGTPDFLYHRTVFPSEYYIRDKTA